jgi:polyisoprenoid-binding protein YceI
MQKKLMLSLISLGFLFILSARAFAHHGAAAYDMSKSVTVAGTITDFQFVNPHVLISMDVNDPSGKVEKWQGELTSPNHLARAGWTKSTLKPGDQVSLTGGPAKSGSPTMWIRKITKDGQEVSLGGGGDN